MTNTFESRQAIRRDYINSRMESFKRKHGRSPAQSTIKAWWREAWRITDKLMEQAMNTTPKRIGRMENGQPQLFDEWQPITKSDPAVIGNIVTYDGGRTFDRVGYDPRRDCLMLDNVTEMVMAAMEMESERIYQTAERVVIGLEDYTAVAMATAAGD